MAEPSTTAAFSVALASGVGSALLVALGINWPALTWAMIGCVVGVSFAPKTGRLRSVLLFIASCLLSAKAGTGVAEFLYQTRPSVAGSIAAATGVCFHPLLSAIVSRIPALVARSMP